MKKSRRVSIARKLTRMNMLVSSAALLLACAGFVGYDLITFRENLVRNLSVQTQVTGSNTVSALVFDDRRSAERTLSAFAAAPNVIAACIYNSQGLPFAIYRRGPKTEIPPSPRLISHRQENYWFEGGNVMLVHALEFQGKPIGFAYIQSDMQALTARLERYLLISAVVLALSLGAALFISRLTRRAIAEPVTRLARVARQVSHDRNYSVRVPEAQDRGELADLVEVFNEMLAQIEHRDQSLQDAHEEMEDHVRQRTAELEAANRELESFAYSVSHDLRAPLRSIDGFSQALAEDFGGSLDENAGSYLARIRAAAQRMGMLIDDMLNLSRVTRSEMRREPVDLSGIAYAVAAELQKDGEARQVEWVIADEIEAQGDARLLRIVMENLLGNAWKYSSKHERARIEFGWEQRNGGFAFFVKDDGAGFDAAYAQRLFGAFQRLHGPNEFPGTGIGLATVQRIIHRHGGQVWAEGAVEKGATFYFSLELKP